MRDANESRHEASLLGLPAELRFIIYAHLIQPALKHQDEDWDERNRGWYRDVYTKLLPETKLIYFTLHALSASCSTLRAEVGDAIVEVRAMLAKQKHYLQTRLVIYNFEAMKSSGMTWEELEIDMGIGPGPDFSAGLTDLDENGCEDPDMYPDVHPGLYYLARRKEWQRMMQKGHGAGYRRWRNLERTST